MVSPEERIRLEKAMNSVGVEYEVHITDVEEWVAKGMNRQKPVQQQSPSAFIGFDQYYPYDDLVQYLRDLVTLDPDNMEVISIGQTVEGRETYALQINKAGPGAPNIYIEGGIHAREWIGESVVTYTLYELVENYEAHPVRSLCCSSYTKAYS